MESLDGAQSGGRLGKNGSPRLNLLQARAYKFFKIGELFDIHPTAAYKLTNRELFATVGNVPVLSNSSENNGIAGYVNLPATEQGNKITFSDTTTSDAIFYQPKPFVGYPHVQGLYAKQEGVWNEKSLLYFLSLFKAAAFGRFDYAAKFTRVIAMAMEVSLPVREDGAIDFAYMEAYIRELETARLRELETARLRELEKYLIAAGFTDCKLTKAERRAVDDWKNGNVPSKVFKAGDLFEVRSNPQLNKESFEFSSNAEYPYFTRTVFNNGILGYVNYLDDEHKIDGGSLAVGMLGMQFFYMQHDFYAGQFTKTAFPKFKGFDEPVALFFTSMFNKGRNQFLKGLVRDFQRLFLDYEVSVPVDRDGNIDLPFVRSFIRGTMKLAIGGVIAWKDKEIAATRSVVSGAAESDSSLVNANKRISTMEAPEEGDYEYRMAAFEETEKVRERGGRR